MCTSERVFVFVCKLVPVHSRTAAALAVAIDEAHWYEEAAYKSTHRSYTVN